MNKQSLISEKAKEMIGLVVGPGESFKVDRELVLRFAESIEEDPVQNSGYVHLYMHQPCWLEFSNHRRSVN